MEQVQYTEREKDLRRRFVEQYLIDYDAPDACRRIGFTGSLALEYARKFMDETFVKQLITERESRPMDVDASAEDDADVMRRRIITSLLRESKTVGPGSSHAARVAALNKLASLYGLTDQRKPLEDGAVRGGVMRVPEPPASLNTWEELAAQQQASLMQDAAPKLH